MTVIKAIAAAFLLAASVACVAAAQAAADFPSRPVKLLVPFAAGGPTDVGGRILADLLSARGGGPAVGIENRPGCGPLRGAGGAPKGPRGRLHDARRDNSLANHPPHRKKPPL